MSHLSDRYVNYERDFTASPHALGSFRHLKSSYGDVYGFEGHVRTPHGTVEVYATCRAIDPEQEVTFRACWAGREYWRHEIRPGSARLTERGAATVAHRWIRQLVEGG